MNVLCVTFDRSGRDAPARALADLGCAVEVCGFDPGEGVPAAPPQALVIDARDRLEEAYACLAALRRRPALAHAPALLVVSTARLTSLDFAAADDFVLFPVVPAELYARVRQLDWRLAAFAGDERIKIGDLVLDVAGHEARLRDRRLALTRQEFALLSFLARRRGKVFTRAQLLAQVWGYRASSGRGTRTVDIHVRRLRAKLGPRDQQMIETVRNVGYKLAAAW